ncbi:mRNA cleavage and polyadenylation factor [Coleophoma cylindrospora]|uniref:Polynucleotide 5'-hydroxyl-kinase GRC3 n=1 Tax=Coleophoma cylindrospora TaxID=1849047 RepID=A0A3D8R5U4_9HELO|nr:mRNA cleavage and polyadenylation factor [Coleophoma cylindrospora]
MSIPGIPGLGQSAPVATSSAPVTVATTAIHELAPNSEWRFEVAIGQSIEVRVLSGTAEIFGTELALNHTYTFHGTKSSIYTWHGTRLEVTGSCEEYIAEETPMIAYVNTHFALEKLRQQAQQDGKEGPRVLVVGPSNSGKTSLMKLLTSYAIRMGRQPLVVNTDSREGLLSIPGCLTATAFASIVDVEQGWGSSPTSGPSPVPVKLPLCYYYGLASPEDNTKLFKPVLTRLALAATSRMAEDSNVKESGMLIDTPGVISQGKGGYDIISHIVSEFSVNTILVLGSERLYSDMQRKFSTYRTSNSEAITLVRLDKSGGCVDRDDTYMQKSREAAIKEYFFGDVKRTLSPHTQQVDFDSLTIYKIRETNNMYAAFLPGGQEEAEPEAESLYEAVEPTSQMQHCLLAVMYASLNDSQEAIRDASVMGFVYVADVDDKKRRVRLLSPVNTRIADRPLILGSWPEPTMSLMG